MMSNPKLTVIDFFCGAGGFSEGFRQVGYEIIAGYDHWKPAIDTFDLNFGKGKGFLKNILDFKNSIEQIEALPDTEIIVGSPPCVTFSSSNISGKADKTSGVTLTQVFLRIVAVKKWKQGSKLKAWYMENVPSSIKHLGAEYTFEELGLEDWAIKNKIGRKKIAIKLEGNQVIINSADYGSPQCRERVIAGEVIRVNKLVIPTSTHSKDSCFEKKAQPWVTLQYIKKSLPRPNSDKSSGLIQDPNYKELKIKGDSITDHFYDTGLYECEWKQSRFLKINHPYMGKMNFPENDLKPSRTITATKIGTSRESIIYRSEYDRVGDGEYRTPTIREAACIMGFPITFQFVGGETTKWRLVGNAVCPTVSKAFANITAQPSSLTNKKEPIFNKVELKEDFIDLNSFCVKEFGDPPKRNKGSRFRRHPFKDGNLTVTLSNYDIDKNEKKVSKWITSVQYGNGKGFPSYNYTDDFFNKIVPLIEKIKNGKQFIETINNGFSEKIADQFTLQRMYEAQRSQDGFLEPTELIEKVREIIENLQTSQKNFIQDSSQIFANKEAIPVKQLFALYAINKICSITNSK